MTFTPVSTTFRTFQALQPNWGAGCSSARALTRTFAATRPAVPCARPTRLGATYRNANGCAFPYGDDFDLDVTPTRHQRPIWAEGNNVGPGGTWFTRGS